MAELRAFMLWSQGRWPTREVVGESFRAKEIRGLFPSTRAVTHSDQIETIARLVPEPNNRYDKNAVKVVVQGIHVGYLAKEEASLYQPVLINLNRSGFEASVPCTVSGYEYDTEEQDKRGRWVKVKRFDPRVSVVLDEWYRCVPVNPPPPGSHVLLPVGSALQAQKEEDHQDVLRRYLNDHGECWAYGTLHEVAGGTPKAPKPLVEVRVDGARVGQLTPAMSAHFLPTIAALSAGGRTTAAQLVIKGNMIRVEVVLYAARAFDLDPSWVKENVGAPVPGQRSFSFNPPPGWPPPPPGWTPPAGWQPNADWPPAPPGWRFWL